MPADDATSLTSVAPATPSASSATSPVAHSRTVRWVAPAYNEEASIGDLIDRMAEVSAAQGWRYEIVVVDDGSADATGDIARERAAAGVPVRVIRNEPNQGLGRTIRRGLHETADESADDDVLITLDADLTQDPGYAPAMLAKLDEGYDVVIASRYQRGSGVEGLSPLRRLLSYGASATVMLLRPIRGVRDYSCGFRTYRARAVRDAFAREGDELVCEAGFACMVEIAERLREHATFAEVPFTLRYDAKRTDSAIKLMPTIGAYFRVIARVSAAHRKPVPVATLAIAFSSIALGAFGQIMLRQGAAPLAGEGLTQTLADALASPAVLTGLALYTVSSALWLAVLSRMDVSVAYPLGATGYVLVVLLAWLSGETVPAARWLGVGLIVLGVLLVGWLGVAPKVGGAAAAGPGASGGRR